MEVGVRRAGRAWKSAVPNLTAEKKEGPIP